MGTRATPAASTRRIPRKFGSITIKPTPIPALVAGLVCLTLPACHPREEEAPHPEQHRVGVTSPVSKDVVVTQQYVCQIRSRRHIEVCALQDGYLQEILVKEGQAVKKGDALFKVLPTLYTARFAAEKAEAQLSQIEFDNTKRLYEKKVGGSSIVSDQEVALAQAKLDKANAKVKLAEAEVAFTVVKAPFDGIVDRLNRREGSLIEKKDVLTTLSDNSVMWVYFNVPEVRYLDYKSRQFVTSQENSQLLKLPESRIELILANGSRYNHDAGDTVTVEATFNNETGNIPFRADFPNPTGLLRNGQTGSVLIHRTLHDAVVIPQRATFEVLDKRYVYVVGEDHVVRQREITVRHELDDVFVIEKGVGVKDKIVVEGARELTDGEKIAFEFHKPEDVLSHQKQRAE